MIDAELSEFLESGCSTIVGLVHPSGHPLATRAWGTEIVDGRAGRARVLLAAAVLVPFAAQPTFPIAVTGADVRTLRSVQLKGVVTDVGPVTDGDLARSARFCAAFFHDVHEVDGVAPELMQRLVPHDLVACTVDVHELYDQTPGPAAGARLG